MSQKKLPRWVWKNEEGRRGWFFETMVSMPHEVVVRIATNQLDKIRRLADSVQGSRREEWQMAAEILAQWSTLEETKVEMGKLGIPGNAVEREVSGEPGYQWLKKQMETYSVMEFIVGEKVDLSKMLLSSRKE